MKIYVLLIALIAMSMTPTSKSIHDYKIQKLNDEVMIDFKTFEGKKILVVNVASKCGFTHQYEDLEALSQKYKDQLVVVGIPCNQFLFQEPGSEAKIQSFCSSTYGVTFPMTTKVKVKGKDQHPIYKFLTSKELNGKGDFEVSWNFNKFLLDEEGKLMAHFPSKVEPLDEEIVKLVEG